MTVSVLLMPSSNDDKSVIGEPSQADGWYGYSDGLHTVSMHVQNFTGRIGIQASLVASPNEEDWIDIFLTPDTPYVQFPLQPGNPTGQLGGDTRVHAVSFKINALWLRAYIDRDYLPTTEPYENHYGMVKKIVLGR